MNRSGAPSVILTEMGTSRMCNVAEELEGPLQKLSCDRASVVFHCIVEINHS